MPAFDGTAILAVRDAILSEGQQLGVFERVRAHEPKNAPGSGKTLAFWWDSGPEPYAGGSGLASVSARVTYMGRIYRSFVPRDDDDKIDTDVLAALSAFYGALSAAFTLLGTVRNVDLLGEGGQALSVRPAYLEQDGKHFRIAEMTVAVILNDIWGEAP